MTDRRFDFDELKAWEEKVRDPEAQRRFEEAWAAEGDDSEGDFIREQEEAKEIADEIAGIFDKSPNRVRSLAEGVVEYRHRNQRTCVLAAAVPGRNGDVFLVWRGGKGVRLNDPETLQRWRGGDVPDSADADAVGKVLDRVRGFEDRFGVATGYRTSSGREAAALGWEGEEFPARCARLSDLPPNGIIYLTCTHSSVALRVGDVWEDLRSKKKTVVLPK